MALFITHGFFASLFSFLWRDKKTKFSVLLLILLASIIPDIDFIFDDRNSGMFYHRGITHSIFFSAAIGVLFSAFFMSSFKSFGQTLLLMFIFFLAGLSHSALDLLTDAPNGVCLLCPFSEEKYSSPFTLFHSYTAGIAPKGFRKGVNSAWSSMIPEIFFVWIPTLFVFFFSAYLVNKTTPVKKQTTYKPVQIKPRETKKTNYPKKK